MWTRHNDGRIQAIILVTYICRNPRLGSASILLLFRPLRREDGKWTAVQDGPTYILYPRSAGVTVGDFSASNDAGSIVGGESAEEHIVPGTDHKPGGTGSG